MSEILKALAVTAELTNTELSKAALLALERDLSAYPPEAVLAALQRCRRELTGRLSPAAIIDRIEARDGRPAANEAWGIAVRAFDEAETVVMNDEIGRALEAARPVMDSGDEVGARMAFRDAYERIVSEAREAGVRPRWYPSLGHDPERRAAPLQAAVNAGLLKHETVAAYLPAPETPEGRFIAGLLTGTPEPMPNNAEFRERIAELKAVIGRKGDE